MFPSSGAPDLPAFLRAHIAASGPLRFDAFMDACLYHPEWGYYRSGTTRVGKEGDFITSVSATQLFGRLMASQFSEMWHVLGKPAAFTIREQGANNGQFAADVLAALPGIDPACAAVTRYEIVEPDPGSRQRQQHLLAPLAGSCAAITWRDSLGGLEPATGVFFSNELVDSFPIRLVIFQPGGWLERCVAIDAEGAFAWHDRAADDPELAAEIVRWELPPVPGYIAELNLRAGSWMRDVAGSLDRGFAVTVDYGFEAETLYHPDRTCGTLQSFLKHQATDRPLSEPGRQDLTAHVNFSLLLEEGKKAGLGHAALLDQHHFFVGLGEQSVLKEDGAPLSPERMKELRAFQTLIHPAHFGTTFKFLVQAKGFDRWPALSGLKYGRI
jgi:SAM-dependent MidA family methyltransferase